MLAACEYSLNCSLHAKQIFYICSCSQKNRSARHACEYSQRPFVTPEKGPGSTPGNSWWGCAARFSKSWPCFRPKNVIFHTHFQTRPLKCTNRKFFGFELPVDPFPGFLIHSDRILASSILLRWSLANWQIISSRLISMLYVGYGAWFQLGKIFYKYKKYTGMIKLNLNLNLNIIMSAKSFGTSRQL